MIDTVRSVSDVPTPDRTARMAISLAEYERFTDALRQLPPDDWARPTCCPGWDVRDMATHVLGFAEAHASRREFIHQAYRSKRIGGNFVDGMTATHVIDRAAMTPAQIIARFDQVSPMSVRARSRMSTSLRSMRMRVAMPGGNEWWPLAYLNDVIFTRDTWMHRSDIARATDTPMVLTADHDGVIVADAVVEWARRHGKPFRLVLGGPAGGEYADGQGGEQIGNEVGKEIKVDAVEFCRIVSGREPGEGLLTQEVPF